LLRFDISKEAKPNIRQGLSILGLREEILFPDLDHLAGALLKRYSMRDPFSADDIERLQQWNQKARSAKA
jgi:hypothetical protein